MTKIDIISGFLGAGKTTLIKELLQDGLKGMQTVLIENEFGEIGIDGSFLKDTGIEIKEMNSGCICCSLVGDFGRALTEVVETYHPDRIIIEPSGVGKLSDVIGAVKNIHMDASVELNSAVTVVDVLKCRIYLKNFGEFFKNQVESAGTIILSRTDTEKATPEKIEEAVKLVRELNDHATIVTTPVPELGGKKVLDTIEGVKIDLESIEVHEEHDECCDHDHDHHDHDHHDHDHHDHDHHDHDHDHHDHDHHHHHADEIFTSWGHETAKQYSRDQLTDILQKLSKSDQYGIVLRAKGMVEDPDGHWLYFDMVPEECEIRDGSPEYTGRLCVIGSKLDEAALETLFGLS